MKPNPVCPNRLKTIITPPHKLCSLCIDVTMVGQIQACLKIIFLRICLDLPYHCDVSTQTAQPQWGVIIVFKLLRHTGIRHQHPLLSDIIHNTI